VPGLVLAAILVGCSQAGTPPRVVERDRAVIRTVENHEPAWASGTPWVVEPEPVLDIGANPGDPAQPFYLITTVVGMGQGLAVANMGSGQVLRFGHDGHREARIGRRGGGPGEFMRLSDLYRCAGDTLIVDDYSRIITPDAQGDFVRTEPIRPAQGGVIGVWKDEMDVEHVRAYRLRKPRDSDGQG
jgi:hypothetical protein